MANIGDTAKSKSGKNLVYGKDGWEYAGMTTGEDIGAAIQSGLRTGVAGIIGLPGAFSNTVYDGLDAAGLRARPEGERNFGFPEAMRAVDEQWNAANDASWGDNFDTSYEPTTRVGKYAKTGAEFLPGAPMVAGSALKALGMGVAAPALTSETAGQLAEGTAAEPYARAAGALLGPTVAATVIGKGSTPAQRAAVQTLKKEGVRPTAGQVSGDLGKVAIEGRSTGGLELIDDSYRSFSQAAIDKAIDPRLKSVVKLDRGLTHPAQVTQAVDDVGEVMTKLAARNTVPTTPGMAAQVDDLLNIYDGARDTGRLGIVDKVADAVKSGAPITGQLYQNWRTQLNALTSHSNPAIRNAVRGLIEVLDDGMEAGMKAAGNLTEFELYKGARASYRNLLTARRALGSAAGLKNEHITPAALQSSIKVREGEKAAVGGKSVFSDLAKAGHKVLKAPRSSGTAENVAAMGLTAGAPAAIGAYLGNTLMPGVGGYIGAAAGASGPALRNAAAPSPFMQGLSKLQSMHPPLSGAPIQNPGQIAAGTRPWWED